jgi:chaperonin GroEL (HSP60 family)
VGPRSLAVATALATLATSRFLAPLLFICDFAAFLHCCLAFLPSSHSPRRPFSSLFFFLLNCLFVQTQSDMENNVVVSDYAAMDRILREERKHILSICKKIKKAGCNVLLIQKSILRDAYNDLSLHFLAKVDSLVSS